MSHFYYLTLPILITFLAVDYGFSPTQLGIFIAAFSIAAAAAQMPVGFLVDAIGARALLVGGILIEALSVGGMAIFASYAMLVALAFLAGLGHSVFHPANYAIMNSSVNESHVGRAFSLHTVTGSAGSALAPVLITYLAALWHWKLALMAVAAFGVVTALAVASQAHILLNHVIPANEPENDVSHGSDKTIKANLRLLMQRPVLVLFGFFLVTTMATGGIQSFAIFTLMELHSVAQTTASTALTVFLIAGAFGVLVGGWVADTMPHHNLIASVAFLVTAAALVLIGEVNLNVAFLLTVFAGIGILQGLVMPARDMMVREAMPPGTAGTIFAFMSTGRLIGSAITPIILGLLIANDMTDKVFLLLAAFSVLGLATLYMPRTQLPRSGKTAD